MLTNEQRAEWNEKIENAQEWATYPTFNAGVRIGIALPIAAHLEQVERERDEAIKLLHDLTPGGSEFYANPQRCFNWAQEHIRDLTTRVVTAIGQRKEAETERDALRHLIQEIAEIGGKVKTNCDRDELTDAFVTMYLKAVEAQEATR